MDRISKKEAIKNNRAMWNWIAAEIQKHVLVGCDRIIMCPTVLLVWSFFANQQRSAAGTSKRY